MAEAPSGTVTFLFTDLVGSTELLDKLGDDEAERLRQTHFQLLREAVAGRHGQEVKNLGDGLMVAFASAVDALACAVAMQEAVLLYNQEPVEHRLEVRIGLHVGEPVRDEDDYFGTAVVVAKRLCDSALGGRILVSDLVRGLIGSRGGYAFRTLGPLPLKGFAEPLPACEVVWLPGGQLDDVEARGLRKLWANRAFRVAAALLALGVIGGGVVGGLFLSGAVGGSGSSAGVAYRKLDIHFATVRATYQLVSGDCQSSDFILRGVFEEPAVLTGDFSGHATFGVHEVTLYPTDGCQWALGKGTFTLTDGSGNTLSVAFQNTINLLGFSGEGPRAEISPTANIITGGTGVYQGATGHGQCDLKATTESVTDSSGAFIGATLVTESDCIFQLTPGGVASADAEPVIFELGAGAARMTVFTSPLDLPKKVYFNVLYFNPRDQMQTGLSLKLRAPDGAEMRAAERGEEEPAAGERVWTLPDLAPGALGRLEFSVTFLSAEADTVDLVAEIAGDGFDPVRSDPLEIEVVQ